MSLLVDRANRRSPSCDWLAVIQQTEAILRWGEDKLGLPWIGAIITHDHADRDGGLGALFHRKIPVAALDLTVAKLARRGVGGVSTLFTARAGRVEDPRGFEAFYPGPGHSSDNIVIAFRGRAPSIPPVLFGGCLIKAAEARVWGSPATLIWPRGRPRSSASSIATANRSSFRGTARSTASTPPARTPWSS
jgi:glyoxylase-like metal-dependent hydrolase (beta-lactamase superfamily II)